MSAVQDAVNIGSSTAQGASVGGPIGAAVGAVKGVITSLVSELAQHSARLQGAKTENAAIPQVVSAFDADIQEIVSAYNSGAATPQEVLSAVQSVDNDITNYLKSGIVSSGKFRPGTSWDAATGFSGKCNKVCTAGCCVYYGDLGPVLSLIALAVSGQPLYSQWDSNDPRWSGTVGNASIQVPKVFSSKYGGANREGYTISLKRPTVISNPGSVITSTVNKLLGGGSQSNPLANITDNAPTSIAYAPGSVPISQNQVGIFGLSTNNPMVLIFGFFALVLVLVLAIGRR